MASTYSEYLRLELIGTGDQTGTWGNTTNTNLGTLLDQAVAGTATIDVTLGDVTLTALNGASDQSRQAILKITGTPVSARNVIAPEQSKWYLVSNDCGQTITLKGASTTGYEIATGETLLMFWNGTDFVPGSSTALGYTPVNKAGDTMSGALYLPSATPTLSTQAATKGYVDSAVSGAVGSNFVLKTGDTMTGPLVLSGAPSTSLQAATKGYVDSAISGAGYATQSWVTSQNYANTSTQSLLYYYTKTDSDSRYVSVNTQALTYYPLTTTVASTYATISSLSSYGQLSSTQTWSGTNTFSQATYFNNGVVSFNTLSGFYRAGEGQIATGYSSGSYGWHIGEEAGNNFVVYANFGGGGVYMNYSGNTWQSRSDRRIKTDLEVIPNALEKMDKISGYTGRMIDDETNTRHPYLIAQEIQDVLPEAVSVAPKRDVDGNGIPDDLLGLGYTDVIPLLVQAIKELKAEVDALKAAK